MRLLSIGLLCHLILAGHVMAADHSEIQGAVAYTDIIRFDYTKDGMKNPVQFWLEFKGHVSVSQPGESGAKPAEGVIHYYLYDVDKKVRVANWLMGFTMMEGPPPSGPYPMTNLVIEGNTARFEAFGMKWTVTDGGQGHTEDRLTVEDGFRQREIRTFDGDLRVVSARPKEAPDYQACAGCHREAAGTMKGHGGRHKTMECVMCHPGHPPQVEKPFTECTQCHQPHSPRMTAASCKGCHTAHAAAVVKYAFNIPSVDCAACHQPAADVLGGRGGKHKALSCALCHPETHKAKSECRHCHGAPHPTHVMSKAGICSSCHNTAHDLHSARTKR